MYQWIVFLHILGAFAFFIAHGASMMMSVQLHREHDLQRIRAILDLSNAALPISYGALLVLVLAGIAAGIMGHWFSQGWIWTAIVLLVVLYVGMHAYAFKYFTPIRQAVGLPYHHPDGDKPAGEPASDAEIAAVIAKAKPVPLLLVSFSVIVMIVWLMMFKPF